MLNGFYNYIAKSTVDFFLSNKATIRPGERYCLRLDTEDMVKAVDKALQNYARSQGIEGTYTQFPNYKTFTVCLSGGLELVVASKINGMTDGFLVKLRNAQLTDKRFPILIVAHDPNDSITSGTSDLASSGMPFHAPMLIARIHEDICNLQLSPADETLLLGELDRKKSDRFSDQTSMYSYSDLLTVLDRGFIEEEDYHAFGLLADPEGSGLVDVKKIRERLALNHKIFDDIDWVDFLLEHGSTELKTAASLAELIRRPEFDYESVAILDEHRISLPEDVKEQVNINIKYEGYIERQNRQIHQFKKMEKRRIPKELDYDDVKSLRIEAAEKLKKMRPETIGMASRIQGVSPADISVLMVYLEQYNRNRGEHA